jgi:hypothetical protein
LFYARGGVRRARCERIVDNERIPRDALEKFSRRIKKERREYKGRRRRTPFEIVQVVVVRGEVEGQQVTTSRG